MIFTPTPLAGAYVIELEPREDERGMFVRTFCAREFRKAGLEPPTAQSNLTLTRRRGSIRGMHYQAPPEGETKLVRCSRGAIHDVIIDLRPQSPTYCAHFAVELTGLRSLYVPVLFAHGFQTLTEDAEVFYQMSAFYAPEHQRGVRYDDPAFGIAWPLPVSDISERDRAWPLVERTGR